MEELSLRDLLNEVSSGLADIEAALQAGNKDASAVRAQLLELVSLMRRPQPAPQVTVQAPNVTVQAPAAPVHNWHFQHVYDNNGRCIETRATPVPKPHP